MMTAMLQRHAHEAARKHQRDQAHIEKKRREMVAAHRAERTRLREAHATQLAEERRARAQQLTRGLRGLWDRITGKRRLMLAEHRRKDERTQQRLDAERQAVIDRQLDERRAFQSFVKRARARHAESIAELRADILAYDAGKNDPAALKERFRISIIEREKSGPHEHNELDHTPR